MRVLFLVRSLQLGGAELQLLMLARGLRDRGHTVTIVTFYPGGPVWESATRDGIECRSLGKRSRWDLLRPLLRLRRLAAAFAPDVLYSMLQGANVLAALARPLLGGARLVWGVRASNMVFDFYGSSARLALAAERVTWRAADLIICNSEAGASFYRSHGVAADRLRVIRNGIDTDAFRLDEEAGDTLRWELQVPDGTPVLGIVGRLDPVKDHATLLAACAQLRSRGLEPQIWCVGDGPDEVRQQLKSRAAGFGLQSAVRWLGVRRDLRAVYNALDLLACVSLSEGFPNVVAEAAACGTPCVVTDVGDSAVIVEETRFVVPPAAPERLAEAILSALRTERRQSSAWRERITRRFSRDAFVRATERALQETLRTTGHDGTGAVPP